MRAHLDRHNKPFGCDECPLKFGSKKDLGRHQTDQHSSEKPYVCPWPDCKRGRLGWPRQDNWKRHVNTVHKGEYGPSAPPIAAENLPGSSSTASRKRHREDSEDSDNDVRSALRKKDERIRELEQTMSERDGELERKTGELSRMKEENNDLQRELSNAYKDLWTYLKEKGA